MKIEFGSDKVKINGPKADNTYNVTFETGEFEREQIAELFKLDPYSIMRVTVEVEG